jgi:hypothetical protein
MLFETPATDLAMPKDCVASKSGASSTPDARCARLRAMGIEQARIINLRKVSDPKWNLTPIERGEDIPFEIRRVYRERQ